MATVKKEGIILRKTDLGFENEGVLNPAVIRHNGKIHMFYRAVAKGNFSTVGYCLLSAPLVVEQRSAGPVMVPENDCEKHGIEDPRIVKIDGLFYLTYTSYDGINALGALRTSKDLKSWQNEGIIVPKMAYEAFITLAEEEGSVPPKYKRYNEFQISHTDSSAVFLWDKNLIFFPRKINGKFYFLHRVRPDIQIVSVQNIADLNADFWQDYFSHFKEHILLSPKYAHESSYIGGGCPPIETASGWLMIYHSVYDTVNGYVYNACAALLDLNHPETEIARLPRPLFRPEEEWELKGEVNNVCFPTGAIVEDDLLYIYYGAADERIAVASVSLSQLLKELTGYA